MQFFFFNDTATTEIYTLSLHDALPIYCWRKMRKFDLSLRSSRSSYFATFRHQLTILKGRKVRARSEERFSRNAETDLVCRLLLEKKKNKGPPLWSCSASNVPRAVCNMS